MQGQRPGDKPAQGNALGSIRTHVQAPQGRDNRRGAVAKDVSPFQGLLPFFRIPRALPWAGMSRAVGAERQRRGDAFTKADVENYRCVFVMMMAAAARKETEVLQMFQDSGRYPGFFPAEDDFEARRELLQLVPNLQTLDLAEGAWQGGPCVKQSLGNMLCLTRPTIILDEGPTAYSPIRRTTVAKFNPSFILELSATPNRARD